MNKSKSLLLISLLAISFHAAAERSSKTEAANANATVSESQQQNETAKTETKKDETVASDDDLSKKLLQDSSPSANDADKTPAEPETKTSDKLEKPNVSPEPASANANAAAPVNANAAAPVNAVVAPEDKTKDAPKFTWGKAAAALGAAFFAAILGLWFMAFNKTRRRRNAFSENTCITIDPEDGKPKKKKKKFGDPFAD